MESQSRDIIVIDPALVTPENVAYNTLSRFVSELAILPRSQLSCIQFHLPFLAKTRLKDLVGERRPAGIIALGSFANLTDRHDWIDDLTSDLTPLLFEKQVPFLGVCFSHQLMAHMLGNPVGFLRNRMGILHGKHEGVRRSRIVHPRFSLLWTQFRAIDYGTMSPIDEAFRKAVEISGNWRGQRWSDLSRSGANLGPEAVFVKNFIEKYTPESYISHVRHEQEVLSLTNHVLHKAATSDECEFDALVHDELPLFSLQGHPETWHQSGDGWRLLKNFIYYCDTLAVSSR